MMLNTTRILVIDDDSHIRALLQAILSADGYAVFAAVTGADGLRQATAATPDLVILDISLPDMIGLDVCRALRVWYDGPCLFLSVKNSPNDKIAALDLGGDDYLTKPFHPGELLARVRACLRRHGHADDAHSFTTGDLTIDFAARRVILAGCELALTRTEYTILALLAQHAGKVLHSRIIAAQVLGGDSADDLHTLRVHISNLRKKLHQLPDGPRYIVTVPGVGFRFTAEAI